MSKLIADSNNNNDNNNSESSSSQQRSATSSAAHVAAAHNDAAALAQLPLAQLAQANADGLLPAQIAAQLGHVAALQVLHSRALLADDSTAHWLLLCAVRGAHLDAVRFFVETCGVKLNSSNNHNNANADSPLMCAVRAGSLPLVRYLCDRGADVHYRGRDSDALLIAVRSGHVPLARALLDAGADVNVRIGDAAADGDVDGNELCTALTLAARNNDAAMTLLLLECGANVNVFATADKDDVYGTHLVQACLSRLLGLRCVSFVRAGADPNAPNSTGTHASHGRSSAPRPL
jgi:ankyrin repeat protein